MTPYILLGRKKLPPESAPSPEHVYDEYRQIWVAKNSSIPLVSSMRTYARASQFGETRITETREGVDQAEGVQTSEYTKTTLAQRREGEGQAEQAVLRASRFGETTITKTREGADQGEGAALQEFDAPYSHF